MAYALVPVLCVLLLLLRPAAALSRKYDRGPLALSKKAALHWSVHFKQKRISLALTITDPAVLSSRRASWIGLGVSEQTSGSMLGADIASARFGANMLANCSLVDHHVPFAAFPLGEASAAAPPVYPDPDDCQTDGSWVLVACARDPASGVATVELERALDAHDAQDREIGPGDQALIFAYGGSSFAYHKKERGSARVVLYNEDGSYPKMQAEPLPKDISYTFDILATNYSVPSANVTTYACTALVLPLPKSGKRTLVAVDPVIQHQSGENKVHHLIVYACPTTPYAKHFAKTGYCMDDGPGGSPNSKCEAFLYGYAVGGSRFLFPEGVGMELNARNNHLILETHYDNPDRATNAVDVSGARLYFAEARPIQAGMITLGDSGVSLFGKKVQHDFKYESSCPSNCTATWAEPINIFVSGMHMHTTGRKMYTNHYDASGKFKQTLNAIEYWSNDHQYFTRFAKPKVVRPGDRLSTTCIFDTRKRPDTKFGLETKDEMCVDFIFYYPVQRRDPSHPAMFPCSFYHAGGVNGTLCGAGRGAFSTQRNPTFRDDRATPMLFGRKVDQCAAAPRRAPIAPPASPAAAASPSPAGSAAAASSAISSPACFPGAALVRTRRGELAMRDVCAGDEVAVGGGAFSRVFMFTHREPRGLFDFVELRTARRSLTLSAGHFLYANGRLTAAGAVRVGDALRLADGSSAPVVAVARVRGEGLYNPQTVHGDIVVDGVTASTYTSAVAPSAAHALLAPLRAAAYAAQCRIRALETDGPARRAAVALSGWAGSLLG